jgi:hypothetical protein
LTIGTSHTIALNNMAPTALRGAIPISISIALEFRILKRRETLDPFTVARTKYFYVLATPTGQEVLAFHWAPDAIGQGEVTFPHVHVGRAVVTDATQVLPRTFHKVHIPTGFVTIGSVIRLAIVEFGVRPLRPDWQAVLD